MFSARYTPIYGLCIKVSVEVKPGCHGETVLSELLDLWLCIKIVCYL